MSWVRIDRITALDPGRSAVAAWTCTPDAFFLPEHFPGFPLVPGVLLIELAAQTGGACIAAVRPDVLPLLATVKQAKFYRRIEPGDEVIISASVELRDQYSVVHARLEVESRQVSAVELMLAHVPMPASLGRRPEPPHGGQSGGPA